MQTLENYASGEKFSSKPAAHTPPSPSMNTPAPRQPSVAAGQSGVSCSGAVCGRFTRGASVRCVSAGRGAAPPGIADRAALPRRRLRAARGRPSAPPPGGERGRASRAAPRPRSAAAGPHLSAPLRTSPLRSAPLRPDPHLSAPLRTARPPHNGAPLRCASGTGRGGGEDAPPQPRAAPPLAAPAAPPVSAALGAGAGGFQPGRGEADGVQRAPGQLLRVLGGLLHPRPQHVSAAAGVRGRAAPAPAER